jgi:thiol-disulfide isomerase/thioredoxin
MCHMKIILSALQIASLVVFATMPTLASAQGSNVPIDFELPQLGGEPLTLSEFRGQWLILNYWATWCAPCRKEIPELSALHAEREDLVVLGLAFEDADETVFAAFLEDFNVSYPILLVDTYDPPQPFGAPKALPVTHILDPEGMLVKSFYGPVTREAVESYIDDAEQQ